MSRFFQTKCFSDGGGESFFFSLGRDLSILRRLSTVLSFHIFSRALPEKVFAYFTR